MIAQRLLTDLQWKIVPLGAVAAGIATGIEAHPGSTANRRLDIAARKPHPTFGDAVDMRGLQVGMPGTTEVIKPQLVEHDEKNILTFARHCLVAVVSSAIRQIRTASGSCLNSNRVAWDFQPAISAAIRSICSAGMPIFSATAAGA